jgi:hypothetical protein
MEHKIFEADVGTWDAELVIVPQPGAEPQRSTGVSVNRMVGPWLVVDFKNHTTGFEGVGLYGWDTSKKKYVGTWVDPMRMALVVAEGSWDGRVMTYASELALPDRTVRWRETTERVDDNTRIFRTLFPLDGGDFEMMTVTYKRRLA